jgi:hypothetical protein
MDNWNKKKTVNNVENSILCLLSSRQCQEILRKSGEKKTTKRRNWTRKLKEYRPLEPPD